MVLNQGCKMAMNEDIMHLKKYVQIYMVLKCLMKGVQHSPGSVGCCHVLCELLCVNVQNLCPQLRQKVISWPTTL
jgi:hypothetical protein